MSTVSIPISERAVEQFRQLPRPQQQALKAKAAALLEQEIDKSTGLIMSLNDFQEAMEMSNEDMVLTFGEVYLTQRNWHPVRSHGKTQPTYCRQLDGVSLSLD